MYPVVMSIILLWRLFEKILRSFYAPEVVVVFIFISLI